jgi:hypothetical protein
METSFYNGIVKYSSIEVALGAMVMSMAVADVSEVEVPGLVHGALFCAVWFIYLLDRLFDARKISSVAVNPRHLFYQQHQPVMLTLLMIVGSLGLFLLPHLPGRILLFGVTLMGMCLLYLLWVFFSARSLPKEVVIAILYSSGISLAPAALSPKPFQLPELITFAVVFLLAFINLVLFSRLEQNTDIEDGQPSFVTQMSEYWVDSLLFSAFLLALLCIIALGFSPAFRAVPLQAVLLLMLVVLWVLFRKRELVQNHLTYRLLGDGIFLFPAILLL